VLTADIPFAFQTASGIQPAGEYRVASVSHDGSVVEMQNLDTGHSAMTGMGIANGNPNDKTPQLIFKCGSESGCTLAAVKMADGGGWSYKAPN
jgi:hypothetical protein